MDPWCENSSSGSGSPGAGKSSQELVFESSFNTSLTTVRPSPDDNGEIFEKLPDSAEYLTRLEAKLRNLPQKKTRQDHKEQILSNLIRSESKQILGILSSADLELDREIESSSVLRQLVPQQPLTHGETVHLVTADQLDISYTKNLQVDEPSLSD